MRVVYITNDTDQDIFVYAGKSSGWLLADIVADVALTFVGVTEIKAALKVAELPEIIKTASDFFKYLSWASKLAVLGPMAAVGRPVEAIVKVFEAFQKMSVRIPAKGIRNVLETGLLDYLSPSAWAQLLGAKGLEVVIMTDGVSEHCGGCGVGNALWQPPLGLGAEQRA